MQDFLSTIASNFSLGQRQLLQKFLQDVQSGRLAADPELLQRALDGIGDLLPMPSGDPTTPEVFNQSLRCLLANLAGLYQEIDLLESAQDRLSELNAAELDRIEGALRDLSTVLASTQSANRVNVQWSDVFYETFGADAQRETDRDWYRPLPTLAVSGDIESFLPLAIDPEDRSLKLYPGGDFSRSVSPAGDPLAQVTVDEMLGLSVDPNHPITAAVDGRYDSYWRELVLSESPIAADPLSTPWLPATYDAGAAVRLHFRWPFAVPFTEVVLRPFSRYPVQILQTVWDNRKSPVQNRARNGSFASGSLYWASVPALAATVSFLTSQGYQNGACCQIVAASGRTIVSGATWSVSGSEFAYHMTGKIKRTEGITPHVLVNWFKANGTLVRTDWDHPTVGIDQWDEYSHLFIAPSGTVLGDMASIVLVADGSGTITFDEISFSRTLGATNLEEQADPEADSVLIPLDNATGTDIWVVLAQPHYEFLQAALPQGELDNQALWESVQLQAAAKADQTIGLDHTSWAVEAGAKGPAPRGFDPGSSPLLKEVQRFGGRVRQLMIELLRYAQPDPTTVKFNRYLYVLGAWEITIRHREYAPQGLYVSLPYQPRGEVREALLLTNPPISQLQDRVRFWMTPRAGDKADKAQLFTGRATFASATENPARIADTHFTLTPVTRRETFDGTDRQNRVALAYHPYVDRDRVWTIHHRMASGDIALPVSYDPNKEVAFVTQGGTLTSFPGYRPLKVTLEFGNGVVARPDVLGKLQAGDIGLAGPEILTPATVTQQITVQSSEPFASIRAVDRQRQQTKGRTQSITPQSLQTQHKQIMTGPQGVALSLYWHKSADDTIRHLTITSGDVLISPSRYTVDQVNGVITVRDTCPNGDTRYNSFLAYYYYQETEAGARAAQDSRSVGTIPTSGVDFRGTLTQSLPITRNVSDYVQGSVQTLRPAVLDELDAEYYPVYEYLIDDRGRAVFANNLAPFGDTPAKVTVEYDTLEIAPRLIIEFRRGGINEFSTKTPQLKDFTLLMQAKR